MISFNVNLFLFKLLCFLRAFSMWKLMSFASLENFLPFSPQILLLPNLFFSLGIPIWPKLKILMLHVVPAFHVLYFVALCSVLWMNSWVLTEELKSTILFVPSLEHIPPTEFIVFNDCIVISMIFSCIPPLFNFRLLWLHLSQSLFEIVLLFSFPLEWTHATMVDCVCCFSVSLLQVWSFCSQSCLEWDTPFPAQSLFLSRHSCRSVCLWLFHCSHPAS